MRTTSVILSFAATVSIVLLAACTSTTEGTGPAGSKDLCARSCAAIERADCENDDDEELCVENCKASLDEVPEGCESEYDALLDCTGKISLECDSEGKASGSGTSCRRQASAFVDCALEEPDGKDAGPKSTDAGPSNEVPACGSIGFADENCDDCREANCCDEGEACTADEDCLDYMTCLRTNQCADVACIETCEEAHPTGKTAGNALLECVDTTCASACQ